MEPRLRGGRPLSVFCLCTLLLALEIFKDFLDPHSLSSLFLWDTRILNLSNMLESNTIFPWVYKWDNVRKSVAADLTSYMDDF